MKVPEPVVKILYNGRDVSADISKNLLSISYTDHTEGESDSIDISIEDVAAKWRNEWYPTKGAELTVSFGYNGIFLNCGVFQIDQIQLSGPPDTISLQGLGAGVSGQIRTRTSFAHENKTLRQIVEAVARKNNFTIQGIIAPIVIERVTQNDETDLAFLKRISTEYGYIFSIRGTIITFMSIFDIENLTPIGVIDRTDLLSYSILDKTLQTYSAVTLKYHNPNTKTVSTSTFSGPGIGLLAGSASAEISDTINNDLFKPQTADAHDSAEPAEYPQPQKSPGHESEDKFETHEKLEIKVKAENNQQAQIKAKAAVYRKNSLQQQGTITVEGNPYLCAGNNFELTGMGKISGIFHIMSAAHTISRSGGWVATLEIKRVGFVIKTKAKSKKKHKPTKYNIEVVQ